jgi:predicted nuclease of predicted toxin-antitoxin system
LGEGSVKLLLDENLSRRLIPALQESFPGSSHVVLVGLERADDRSVWAFAKANDYVILTKDDDFTILLTMLGYPPKVILLKLGNSANHAVITALQTQRELIENELGNAAVGLVAVY